MVKEVEKEFNRINCQNIFMSDNDDESLKDDEKSVSSVDTDDNVTSNVHSSTLEMPSISEEVDDNNNSPVKDDSTKEQKKQKEEEEEEKNDDVGKQRYSTHKENIKEVDEKEEEDSERGSPIPIVEENDIFKVNVVRHGSHSLVDFEGMREYYSDDDSKSLSRKRYSFPLTAYQSKNISVKDSIFKGKSESPVLPEMNESANKADEVVKEDNVSVSIKSSNDSIQDGSEKKNKDDEKEEKDIDDNKENIVDNDVKVSSEENEIDKNSIIPLNDMLEDTPNNDDKEEEEVDIVSPLDNNNKFASKSCDSLENIKKYASDNIDSETKSPTSKSEQAEDNNKSNDSVHIHESTSSDSLVINEKGDDSFIASSDNVSTNNLSSTMNLSADNLTRINNNSEDFSFNKLRNKFGGMTNGSEIALNEKTIEENNSRKEELKNIILPSKIHNTPTHRKRGLIINTLFEENKTPSCDSPTRFIYDISKNPFIIKDMSTHKSKGTKSTDNDSKKIQPRTGSLNVDSLNLGGSKVSSIQKEVFSKDNKKPEVTSPDKKKLAKSPLAKEIQFNGNTTNNNINENKSDEVLTKSPLSKEIQFNESLSISSNSISNGKSDENRKSKSVKFGGTVTMDNGLSPASCCVNSKRSSYNRSPTALSSPTIALSPTTLTNSNNSIASNSSINNSSASISTTNNIRNAQSKETGPKTNITKSSSNINRPVNEAKIVDVEIVCIESSKKYVYVIEVDRGLSDIYNVRHTYDDFFDLHLQLIGNFPEEAGVSVGFNKNNGTVTRRIIPDLPAQMMFVSEAIARSRISRLQEYINTILKLPGKISKHPLVMNFFKTDGKWSTSVSSIKKS